MENFMNSLLPTPQTFTKYGFKNVKGQQTFQQENVSYTDEYNNNEINGKVCFIANFFKTANQFYNIPKW